MGSIIHLRYFKRLRIHRTKPTDKICRQKTKIDMDMIRYVSYFFFPYNFKQIYPLYSLFLACTKSVKEPFIGLNFY